MKIYNNNDIINSLDSMLEQMDEKTLNKFREQLIKNNEKTDIIDNIINNKKNAAKNISNIKKEDILFASKKEKWKM